MKKIWSILKDHVRSDFEWPYYASVAAFLAANIALNSLFDWEEKIDWYNGTVWRLAGYFLLYSFAYYGGFAIVLIFKPEARRLLTLKFWILSLAGVMILTLDSGFPYFGQIVVWVKGDYRVYSFAYSVLSNAIGFIYVFLPLMLVHRFLNVRKKELYGLIAPGYDFKPYLLLLMLMAPMIAGASFTEGFKSYYPTYKYNLVSEALSVSPWIPVAVFEFFYSLDFFNVELLFRGFMVIGLSHLIGKDAIIPMVTTYCFIHFGKPVGEAISSIFGGYILGVLAFYTRGIWGGVVIHIGIALLMELFAFLQKL